MPPSQASQYVGVVAVEDLRAGFATTCEVEGREIVLTRTDAGVRAWDATCPHADFQFGDSRLVRGCLLECPMHGARFDVDADGAVAKGPAKAPLEPVDVRVQDGTVEVLVDWLL